MEAAGGIHAGECLAAGLILFESFPVFEVVCLATPDNHSVAVVAVDSAAEGREHTFLRTFVGIGRERTGRFGFGGLFQAHTRDAVELEHTPADVWGDLDAATELHNVENTAVVGHAATVVSSFDHRGALLEALWQRHMGIVKRKEKARVEVP